MVTVNDLAVWKAEGRRFAMLTAYDYTTARILDEAAIPVILVGDSLANVVLGHETTLPVTMDEMIHHTRAVARGVTEALVVADMPFLSYQASLEEGVRNAGRFLKEAGARGVKVEGPMIELAEVLVSRGIPVMGHLGLTPQSVHAIGGYRVQGRSDEAAERLLTDAKELERAGVFSLVLEAVPAGVAARVTESVSMPTIGIGAGPHCDAQVLVINDLLGLSFGKPPKFVRRYADVKAETERAVKAFAADVEAGAYPGDEHTYGVTGPVRPNA